MAKEKKIKDVEAEEVKEESFRKNRKVKDIEKEVVEEDDERVGDYDEIDVEKAKNQKEGYFAGVKKEMKKVRWASGAEVLKNSLAVVIFVLIFVGFFELVYVLAGLLKEWLS